MDITVLRARIIAITFMAGLAWSEGSVADAMDGSRGEKEVEATLSRQYGDEAVLSTLKGVNAGLKNAGEDTAASARQRQKCSMRENTFRKFWASTMDFPRY